MASPKKNHINLLRGWPSLCLLPTSKVKAASVEVLGNADQALTALSYGPDLGYTPLREEIARWLGRFYGSPGNPEMLCITGGASQNLAAILQAYTDPLYTHRVWMVCPSYFLACRIFEDSGLGKSLRAVPEGDEGIDVDYLEAGMSESLRDTSTAIKPARSGMKVYRQLIYAVPTFSNPSGKTMSLNRRRQLVKLARQYDALVITDDVYDFLQWSTSEHGTSSQLETALLPRLVDIDRDMEEGRAADGFGNAVSNGSFSKIIGPGCRTGWAEGSTEKFARGLGQLGSRKSGGAPSQLVAAIIAQLLARGILQQHISEFLQPAYASRYRTMVSAVNTHLIPLGVTISQAEFKGVFGGYFLWIDLPRGLSADRVTQEAKEKEELTLGSGTQFAVKGDESVVDLTHSIRLCFAWEDEAMFAEGIQRLAGIIKSLLPSSRI